VASSPQISMDYNWRCCTANQNGIPFSISRHCACSIWRVFLWCSTWMCCLAALGSALLALCALFARLTLVGALICPWATVPALGTGVAAQ